MHQRSSYNEMIAQSTVISSATERLNVISFVDLAPLAFTDDEPVVVVAAEGAVVAAGLIVAIAPALLVVLP